MQILLDLGKLISKVKPKKKQKTKKKQSKLNLKRDKVSIKKFQGN